MVKLFKFNHLTNTLKIMKKLLNQLIDLPNMVNSKLPMNNFISRVEGSEKNIAKRVGRFYQISAFIVLITSLLSVLSPIWNGGMGEGLSLVGVVLTIIIWVYAAFPISRLIRRTGDSLADSKSEIVDFVFRDLAVANIKLFGHVGALVALFGAFCMTISWATSIDVSGDFITSWLANIDYAYALPMATVTALAESLRLVFISNIVNNWSNWDPTLAAGSAWSEDGFFAVLWEYVGVVIILAKLYVALAIYNFFYGIITSLVKWIKRPYLPFRTS